MQNIISPYSDEYFMKPAMDQAYKAFEEGEIPIGAVIVCNNKIIAKGYNQTQKLCDVTAHAEMIAITAASNYLGAKYLSDCDLYVTLEPCFMCAGALKWAQIRKIIFAATDNKHGFTFHNHKIIHPKTEVKSGVLASESEKLLNQFFEKLR